MINDAVTCWFTSSRWYIISLYILVWMTVTFPSVSASFIVYHNNGRHQGCLKRRLKSLCLNGEKESNGLSSFDDKESSSSKGIVSILTDFFNFVGSNDKTTVSDTWLKADPAPSSPEELLTRIKSDYVDKNYLWTGDIDVGAFERTCKFTDPTLSFSGVDTFVSNVQNLTPIIDALCEGTKSDLLDIQLNKEESYVETRWNMVGDFTGLPWKPRVDVIGRTKFWYREDKSSDSEYENVDGRYQIYFYDEKWEMSAGKALLQLVTPGN
mmetsp:Transcript_12168/g.15892  ORF Transcript_12168/g.15892 Transcript_12168/m.15892 type:complete len:267 (+) Transcript_12168:99-899(+)